MYLEPKPFICRDKISLPITAMTVLEINESYVVKISVRGVLP